MKLKKGGLILALSICVSASVHARAFGYVFVVMAPVEKKSPDAGPSVTAVELLRKEVKRVLKHTDASSCKESSSRWRGSAGSSFTSIAMARRTETSW